MIVVRVELWSAVTGQKTELARMQISNVGGSVQAGDYHGSTFTGRSEAALHRSMDRGTVTREGHVENHHRLKLHVWHLVAKMLAAMKYGDA